jgi:hypothetical protein
VSRGGSCPEFLRSRANSSRNPTVRVREQSGVRTYSDVNLREHQSINATLGSTTVPIRQAGRRRTFGAMVPFTVSEKQTSQNETGAVRNSCVSSAPTWPDQSLLNADIPFVVEYCWLRRFGYACESLEVSCTRPGSSFLRLITRDRPYFSLNRSQAAPITSIKNIRDSSRIGQQLLVHSSK